MTYKRIDLSFVDLALVVLLLVGQAQVVTGQSVCSNITSTIGASLNWPYDLREAFKGGSHLEIRRPFDMNTGEEGGVVYIYKNESGIHCKSQTIFVSCNIDSNQLLTLVFPRIEKMHEGWYKVIQVNGKTDFTPCYLTVLEESVYPKNGGSNSQYLSLWLLAPLCTAAYLFAR